MQDFLTESGELLEQLDRDLVLLEETPGDLELLNRIFRALHTIKGSASFLALTNLVALTHSAESCLNAARNRVFMVDRPVMDLLLQAIDILKIHFGELGAGNELTPAPPTLIAKLAALGEGRGLKVAAEDTEHGAEKNAPVTAPNPPAPVQPAEPADDVRRTPLQLEPSKADLLGYLVSDIEQTLVQLDEQLTALTVPASRTNAAATLGEVGEMIGRSAAFFEFEAMDRCATLLARLGASAGDLPEAVIGSAVQLGRRVLELLKEQVGGLEDGMLVDRPAGQLPVMFRLVLEDQQCIDADDLWPSNVPVANTTTAAPIHVTSDTTPASSASAESKTEAKDDHPAQSPGKSGAPVVEQTIRVEVGRLEALLNLVGELVLQKNRLGAIARKVVVAGKDETFDEDLADALAQSTGGLDRLTSDIQVAVMRTRMQPLDKLFGKYPRLIRDLARKTGKEMRLVVEGGHTEVDKSVIEELADPLVHLMRNSADHGIEPPEERLKAGKPQCGTITISASHEGSHVLIGMRDDGRGLHRDRIGAKAVKQGLITESELAAMSDREVQGLIFAAGFSTADQVSDLSGRGVGMDVVRTNIEKIKGSIELESEPGKGTYVAIKIPLTVAIMTAMMVGVGEEIYAIPLHNIHEIVKPEKKVLSTIRGTPVMRLRESVLPLLNASDVFNVPEARRQPTPFAVVLGQGDKRVGLQVTRLIGQQQIVIKPLDIMADRAGPVSGATVRDDGGVSLIVDVAQMIALAQELRHSTDSAEETQRVAATTH